MDLHCGIDSLVAAVRHKFNWDLSDEGSTFLLCGKSIDWINALLYENYGSLLPYKHLSDCKFRLPRNKPKAKSITSQQYIWLINGIVINRTLYSSI